MKRLFTVGYGKNQKFFDKKEKAKEYRDALNKKFFDKKEYEDLLNDKVASFAWILNWFNIPLNKAKEYRDALNSNKDRTFRVSRGPAHMGKHGSTGPSKMRRKPPHCSW